MSDYYPYKKKNRNAKRPVSQNNVRQALVKFDFRDEKWKKDKIKNYAESTGTTFTDLMKLATDNLITAILDAEIEGI